MNLASHLRGARAHIDSEAQLFPVSIFFAVEAIPQQFRLEAIDLLERVFIPASAAVASEKDDRRRLQLNKVPFADLQLFERLESMQKWEVLAGFDRAILKARSRS